MDRRTRYIETALGLFTEHGYNGVSMTQIVEATGGSKETLYRYFDSKQALFTAIIDELMTNLAAVPEPPDYVELPLAEGLRLLAQATATAALSEQAVALTRLSCGEYSRFPELGQLLFEHAPGRAYARFRDFLHAKQQRGEVDFDDPQIAAEHFLAGLVGHQKSRMVFGAGTPTQQDIDRRVDAAITMFIRTYATDQAQSEPATSTGAETVRD